MPVSFRKAAVGQTILVYTTEGGAVVNAQTDNVTTAHVAALYHCPVQNDNITAVLLGWKKGDKMPPNIEFRETPMWRAWGNERYTFSKDIDECTIGGLWIRDLEDHHVFAGYAHDGFGRGPIVQGSTSKAKYIRPADVLPGDVIAWITADRKLNHAVVRGENTEGESIAEDPIVILDAEVYCSEGQRSFPQGYPMPQDCEILLLSRRGA